MSKTVLVTGCCGFIGSHLSTHLIRKKYKVIGVDNLLTGNLMNIKNLSNNTLFNFINHDVCKPITLDCKVDSIFHFASTASPKDYLKYPIKTLQIGSRGTENILKFGLKNNATVMVASTSEIYGDPLINPQNETYYGNVNTIGPRGVYDEAKRYLEAITMAYHRKEGLNIRIPRIFNTYGPKMRVNDGRAIPNFINQALKNKNFTVYGNGQQTRSFCYIDDTIEAIYKLFKSNYNQPINIGNPKELNILELVGIIKKLIPNSLSKISFKDLPINDPKIRRPDITIANDLLKWEPKIGIKEGLKKTIEYFYKLNR